MRFIHDLHQKSEQTVLNDNDNTVLFADQPEDVISSPCVGRRVKSCYVKLFPVPQKNGHEDAQVVVNAHNGALLIEYIDQVSYGCFLTTKCQYRAISYPEMYNLARENGHDKLCRMTQENYYDYLSASEKEAQLKALPKQRALSFEDYAKECIKIDWMFMHFKQRFVHYIFFLRKTQTCYRLLSIRSAGESPGMIGYLGKYKDKDLRKIYSEDNLAEMFLGHTTNVNIYGDDKEDIILSKKELNTLICNFDDICNGKYRGKEKIYRGPSIYGEMEAFSCCGNKIIKIADYPKVSDLFDCLRNISNDKLLK